MPKENRTCESRWASIFFLIHQRRFFFYLLFFFWMEIWACITCPWAPIFVKLHYHTSNKMTNCTWFCKTNMVVIRLSRIQNGLPWDSNSTWQIFSSLQVQSSSPQDNNKKSISESLAWCYSFCNKEFAKRKVVCRWEMLVKRPYE